MATQLIELVENLAGKRVVLVGDLMMDRYLYGNAERLSPEAPVPVLHIQREEFRLGGAGSVAADLAALGAIVRVVGLVGDDATGRELAANLAAIGCDTTGLVTVPGRPTTCKTRLVGLAQHRHAQQMMRLDMEDASPLPAGVGGQVVARFSELLDGVDAVCLEDYNKGLLTDDVTKGVIAVARGNRLPVLVDPAAIRDYRKYFGATCIKLNRTETEKATGLPLNDEPEFAAAATWLLQHLGLDAAVITLDKNGAYLGTRDGQRQWLRTRARQVYDVTGAGDMVLAMLTVARAAGATWQQATALANVAGGLEVEKFGSVPIKPAEVIAELLAEVRHQQGKQRTPDALAAELARHRAAGKRIVFTNGCFDLLHLGHVSYFRHAKAQGDLLVVGVNTDASIRRLKGDKRPIISESDRLSVLEELESIDYLVSFDDDTPLRLIRAIRPDVLVKGADYAKESVVGWDFVEGYGGRVELAPLIEGRSTSALVERIVASYGSR